MSTSNTPVIRIPLMVCMLVCFQAIFGQQYPMKMINAEDGLIKTSIYRITKDHQGYMWMATDAAVTRYDGTDFVYYGYKQGVLGNFVMDIDFDSSNTMWISTYGGGIASFNGSVFSAYNTTNGFPADYMRWMIFTRNNEMWACSEDVGVIRKEKNKMPVVLKDTAGNNFLNPWQVFEDKDGNIWSAGVNGIYFFNRTKNFAPEFKYFSGFTSTCFASDKEDNLWCGGAYSLVKITTDSIIDYTQRLPPRTIILRLYYSKKRDELFVGTVAGLFIFKNDSITTLDRSNGVTNHQFWEIFEDENADIWLGSGGGGVVKYDSRGISYTSGKDGLTFESMLLDILELADDRVIFSTELNGYFLYENGTFKRFTEPKLQRIVSSYATADDPASKSTAITSTDGKIYWLQYGRIVQEYAPSKIGAKIIYDIHFIDSTRLMVATDLGMWIFNRGADTLVPAQNLPVNFYRSIFKDEYQQLWILGDNGDVFCWNNDRVTALQKQINPDKFGMLDGYYDPMNKLWWFCTNQDVLIWDGKNRYTLNSDNGLNSDMAVAIAQDKQGTIWLGHDRGITGVNVQQGTFTHIGPDQGFKGGICNWRSLMIDHTNRMWIGSDKDLYWIDLTRIHPSNKHTRLRLQEIGYRNQSYFKEDYYHDTAAVLYLKHNQNNLDFRLKALDFINSKEVKYTWMLQGYDDDFMPYNKNNQAVYTNLPPGEYVFIARAIDSDGFATNEVRVKFEIQKPVWERFWFYALEVALFAGIVVMSFVFSSRSSNNRFGQVMTFLTIIILFESIIFYLGNFINPLTNGIPVFQLGMNIILAAILQPLEQLVKKSMLRITRRKK